MQEQTMQQQSENHPQRSNTTLWIMLASFLLPAIIAYGYFFFGDRPSVASNGELIDPVHDIESFGLSDETGSVLDREALTPKWRMYYFVDSTCNENCQKNLFNMRQINVALGKNKNRVEHVVVHMNKPGDELIKLLETDFTKTIRVHAKKDTTTLDQNLIQEVSSGQYIYLMDPLGNVMMRFSEQLNPKMILKDINKLLKISRIG